MTPNDTNSALLNPHRISFFFVVMGIITETQNCKIRKEAETLE